MSFRYVRPDENWIRTITPTASSAQTGYPATNVKNDDSASPWWASSGTATLTVPLGAAREVGIICLVHNNGDDARTITIGGDISTTISAARQANSYPENVAYIPGAPATATNLTIAISGNSLSWAIGEVVIGKLRTLPSSLLLDPMPSFKKKRNVINDSDEDHDHIIRTDLGSELWACSGRFYHTESGADEFIAWWETTKGGVIPTLIVPDDMTGEPRLVRMDVEMDYGRLGDDQNWVPVKFTECSRGVLVQ